MKNEIPKAENDSTRPAVTVRPVTRCKVKVGSVIASEFQGKKNRETVNIYGVYSDDPNSENRKWALTTPAFNLSMVIDNPGAFDKLKTGMEYYLDFIPVAD
jgi:hypothetical protein